MPRSSAANKDPLGRLWTFEDRTANAMLKALKRAQDHVAAQIARAAKEGRIVGAGPQKLYNEIAATDNDLSTAVDKSLRGAVFHAAQGGSSAAGRDAAGAELVKFNRARLERYWEYVRPVNRKSLAAVFTDKMTQEKSTDSAAR